VILQIVFLYPVPLTSVVQSEKWDKSEYHSKTAEEIVRLGPRRWYAYLEPKMKGNEDSWYPDESYGDALQHLNHKIIAGIKDNERRNWFRKFEDDALEFTGSARDCLSFLSGGGTMWRRTEPALDWRFLHQAIRNTLLGVPPPRPQSTSLRSQVNLLLGALKQEEKGNGMTDIKDKEALKDLKKARTSFLESVRVIEGTMNLASKKDRPHLQKFVSEAISRRFE
jgi:hypothetical protein